MPQPQTTKIKHMKLIYTQQHNFTSYGTKHARRWPSAARPRGFLVVSTEGNDVFSRYEAHEMVISPVGKK
jgi:hypothetical protein